MKRKLLSLLVLLMTAVTGAWAQNYLYLEVDPSDNTSATLKYGDPEGKPYYDGSYAQFWYNLGSPSVKTTVQTITVATSCASYGGNTFKSLFNGFSALTTITGLGTINAEEVTDMTLMFNGCSQLTSVDFSGLNTAKVTTMDRLFKNCSSLTSVNFSGFSTASVTDMSNMFYGCTGLQTLTFGGSFSTASVTTMVGMFQDCSSLQSLDLSGFSTAGVTKMSYMFFGCSSLQTLDLSGFSTSGVTDMSYMFSGCSSLQTLDLSGFNTAIVTNMSYMFRGCSGLTTLTFGSSFNTSSVTDMSYMFQNCTGLQTLDLSSFNTSSVTTMNSMFRGCTGLKTLDISSFNTGNDTKMGSMFNSCSSLTAIFVGDGWSVGSSANSMFTGCTNLPNWDETSNGTKAYYGGDGKGYLTYKPAGAVILTAGAGDATNEYWATYYNSTQGFTADASTTVYQAAVNTGKTAVVLTPVTDNEIPAGQAVVLKSSTLAIMLTPATTTQTLDYNELRGSDVDMAPLDNAYCLTKGTQMGFYRYTGTIPANRAYMVIEGVPGADARGFYGFGEEETSIQAIDNGQLTIDNEVYDLQGRRVSQPTKGLYIVNGKKMVIK